MSRWKDLLADVEKMALAGYSDEQIAVECDMPLDLVTAAVAIMDLQNFEKDMETNPWETASVP